MNRRDLLIVVPTRGRPESVRRLIDAVEQTATENTDLIFGVDNDDQATIDLVKSQQVLWQIGPRKGMAEWTNELVQPLLNNYTAFASLGDDHVPRTPGWDKTLLEAISKHGGIGISYGNDLIMGERLPTAPVVSWEIIVALGWMCAPGLSHMCVDNVIKDIGMGAGCLTYCPDVIIEHLHWCAGKAVADPTYLDAGIFSTDHPDWIAYQEWREKSMNQDIEIVKDLIRD